MDTKICAILGVGPGNGLAFARKFSGAGYGVALCARRADKMAEYAPEIDGASGYGCDVSDQDSLKAALAAIRDEMGPIDTLIYNAGSAAWGSVDDLQPQDLQRGFEVNAIGLFSAAKLVLPQMREAGHGNIVVIGAGAALRGRPATISFAASKAAQRSVAQSLARQLGPENIHVSYIVLDGAVDLEATKARMPDKPDTFYLAANGVADAALMLVQQDRQAWSFEIDLRPFGESW
jgi:NADP-dependent 3-hydroxy acid dehydrogenase YdfG